MEILLRFPQQRVWRAFRQPATVFEACSAGEVRACLRAVDHAVRTSGCAAAGYVAYEAAAAFGFQTHSRPGGDLPLAWFGLFPPDRVTTGALPASHGAYQVGPWTPSLDAATYASRIGDIKRRIEAGDTYQINFTFRLRAAFAGDARALFRDLCEAQQGPWAAYLDLGRHVICSASPERFFAARQGSIVCEPMKGTAPRGLYGAADRALALALRRSEKDRAENVMIVDVVRNDLGRVAEIGSVRVPRLFDVSRYPNVWQMTSRVTARAAVSFPELFEALFPAASITGAPKIRSARIIHDLEDSPRGVYTGAIGCIEPGGLSHFNVAIRTVTLDRVTGTAEFGVGSGIVWDSGASEEYDECLLKAQMLTGRPPAFDLLETLAWSPTGGFELLQRHLRRLRSSAAYFGIACDPGIVRRALDESVQHGKARMKVRLLLGRDGSCRCSATPLPPAPEGPARAALAQTPVDPRERWLYHKTTCRGTYDRARAERPDCDEVILWNTAGDITEGTMTNVVVEIDGRKVTPPIDAGLLAGTFRAQLLASGAVAERRVRVDELRGAARVWIVNSVRGWQEVKLVD